MQNKNLNYFVISHLKQAIYDLETANKLKSDVVDLKLIEQIKVVLDEQIKKLS